VPIQSLDSVASSTLPFLDSQLMFAFAALQANERYKVTASALGFVSAELGEIMLSEAKYVLEPVELSPGLVNDEDAVSIPDIRAVASSFGQPVSGRMDALDRLVDIDVNHVVDTLDISALASYFGLSSPLPWPE
jgi:hypothetical protein